MFVPDPAQKGPSNVTLSELLGVFERCEQPPLDARITDLYMVHGTRQKKTPEQIKREGICSWETPQSAIIELAEAAEHFGLLKKKKARDWYRCFIGEMSSEHRLNIYASTYTESSCGWAVRSPEFISLMLGYSGIPREKIAEYLGQRFGKPYRIKTRISPTVLQYLANAGANINTGRRCIRPEDIIAVEECPVDLDFFGK